MKTRLTAALAALALSATTALAAPPDSVTIGMVLEPPVLDPTRNAAAAIGEVVYDNVLQGLTRFGPDGSILPCLADSWDVSAGGSVYVFHLHPDVKFQNGEAFDASVVKAALDRARAADSVNPQKPLFAGIDIVDVVDPLTVKVTLKGPDGAFPSKMAWAAAAILAPASAAATAAEPPIGTGPYKVAEWTPGDHVTIREWGGYWGKEPAIPTATFRFISDPTAAFAAVMAGEVDAFPNFPAPETLDQFKADPRFKVVVGTTEGETILAMNERNAPLNDIRVREAIAHAINRQDVIDGAMFGYGAPIGTHFPPHNPAYKDLTALSAYDPARSKALLAEAGVTGLKLRLALPPPVYARRGGEIIQQQLAAVGIETEITNMEWAQWLDQVFKRHDFDLTIISHTEPNDINIYARPDYYFGYDNPKFQALMKTLDETTDPAKRTELLGEAQETIAKDYVNAYLFQLAKAGVAKADLEGLWANAPTPANDLTGVYWKE